MFISVRVGERKYGGYPWGKYTISVDQSLNPDGEQSRIQITFLNAEQGRVYGPSGWESWGHEPTSNTEGTIALSRMGARALYHLLGEILMFEPTRPAEIDGSFLTN